MGNLVKEITFIDTYQQLLIVFSKMDVDQEVEKIKKELLNLILDHLKKNKIETGKAQQLARDFLNLLPIKDQKDLLLKLKELGGKYSEAKTLYLQEFEKVEEEKRDQALIIIRDYIQKGDIENATKTANSLIYQNSETNS